MTASRPSVTAWLAVLAAAVFALDVTLTPGWVPGLLYAPLLLLTLPLSSPRAPLALAAVCTALLLLGLFWPPADRPFWPALGNRSLGLATLWAAAVVLARYRWALPVRRAVSARPDGPGDGPARSTPGAETPEIPRDEAALQEHNALFRTMADAAPVLIWAAGADGGCTYFNRSWLDFTGRTLEQELGDGWAEGVHPEDRGRCVAAYRAAFDARAPFELEYRLRRADGAYRWILDRGAPRMLPDGGFAGYVGSAIDITDRRRAEEELRMSETLLKQFVERAPAAVAMFDADMRYLLASRRWLADYGVGDEPIVGRRFEEVSPEIPDRWKAVHRRALAGAVERCEEDLFMRKDGSLHWLRWEVRPWWKADGAVGGLVMFSEVITERKRAQEALHESEERFRQFAEHSHDGIWIGDYRALRLDYVNPAYQALWGRPTASLVVDPTSFLEAVHPEDRPRAAAMVRERMQGRAEAMDYRILGPSDTVRWVRDRAFLIRNAEGAVHRIAGIIEDITDRKLAEEQLQRTTERLRALTAHLETVRKEERTRIARELHDEFAQRLTCFKLDMAWLAARLPEGSEARGLPAKLKHMAAMADESIAAIRKLVAELRPPVLDHLDLMAALEWLARDFQTRTGVACEFSCRPDDLTLDEARTIAVFRIVQEALTNVARHAEATRVTVLVEHGDGTLRLAVEDNGRGIAEDRIVGAASFGLLGMRERVTLLGGEIAVRRRPERGTAVTVRLPLEGRP
jgi:hypothetical protein